MFEVKYYAINTFTGIVVKKFRTKIGAETWYRRPIKLAGIKFSKRGMLIELFRINQEEV